MIQAAWALAQDLLFNPARLLAILAIVALTNALTFCETKKQLDRRKEIAELRGKVTALQWGADVMVAATQGVQAAADREIAARHQAEARAREESDDADEWEKRYNEANDALGKVKCEPLSVQPASPAPAIRCPDPFFSPGELQRLRAKYPPAKARPSGSSR
jgi:hypothetical protein